MTAKQRAAHRKRTAEFLADADCMSELLDALADGHPLQLACTRLGIAYAAARRHLVRHYSAAYDAARHVMADAVLDEIAELEHRRALGDISPELFKDLTASKRWRIEKMNPAKYGARQNIDMRTTDMNRLHADAVRELASRPRAVLLAARQLPAASLPAPLATDAQLVSPQPALCAPIASMPLHDLTAGQYLPDQTAQQAQHDQTDQHDQLDRPDQSDQHDRQAQLDQHDQPDQLDQHDQPDQLDQPDQSDQHDQTAGKAGVWAVRKPDQTYRPVWSYRIGDSSASGQATGSVS